MTYGMIATWEMAYDGLQKGLAHLKNSGTAADALEKAICAVEDEPTFQSAGYGGLPNAQGVVEMDSAYMDGNTFQLGAVAGITDVKNPIKVARKLSHEKFNSFLVGAGATAYAKEVGFTMTEMLTEKAAQAYQERLKAMAESNLSPYDGHDTVGMVSLDDTGSMVAGTSTSGLFMKRPGRVGDSPLAGSGLYVDAEVGGACATGLGEDLMKGCLSYEIVRLMKAGLTPQAACDEAVYSFDAELTKRYGKAGAFSLIAMNNTGDWGVATNVEFTFVVGNVNQEVTLYTARPDTQGGTIIQAQ